MITHSGHENCMPHVFKTSLLIRLFEHNTALMMLCSLKWHFPCMEIVFIENGRHPSAALSPDTSNLTSFVHFQRNALVWGARLSEQCCSDAELVKASVRHSSGACLTFITFAIPLCRGECYSNAFKKAHLSMAGHLNNSTLKRNAHKDV